MIPFSFIDVVFALSVLSAVAGLGLALFLLARRQRLAAAPMPKAVEAAEAAEATQPAAA